jgi:small neutral amino acid transporter SnatA (MarC family)
MAAARQDTLTFRPTSLREARLLFGGYFLVFHGIKMTRFYCRGGFVLVLITAHELKSTTQSRASRVTKLQSTTISASGADNEQNNEPA